MCFIHSKFYYSKYFFLLKLLYLPHIALKWVEAYSYPPIALECLEMAKNSLKNDLFDNIMFWNIKKG